MTIRGRTSRRGFLTASVAVVATGGTIISARADKIHQLLVVVRAGQAGDVLPTGKRRTWQAWRTELRRLGYVEGRNLDIKVRAVESAQVNALAGEIATVRPDAIFAPAQNIVKLLKTSGVKTPIVTIAVNPVGSGLAASLAHPGGNITGLSLDSGQNTLAKRIELLKTAAPAMTRMAILILKPYWKGRYDNIFGAAARQLGISVIGAPFETPADEPQYRQVFARLSAAGADSLYVTPSPENFLHRRLISELAVAARLPSISFYPENAEAGGLMSYGPDLVDIYGRAAGYLDRILKGGDPATMPIEQPTKFDLVVNLRTAKALGLSLPPGLLVRANDIIE
jgi:ABC-type uncharacterized transport system substrate-binding protein